jgi:enoyl-CoA hydratase/carnithine racemase
MQRLKRVFAIEIERCYRCGGGLEVIASIEEPALIVVLTVECCEFAPMPQAKDSARQSRAPRSRTMVEPRHIEQLAEIVVAAIDHWCVPGGSAMSWMAARLSTSATL